jgi:triosephosphate isomerase
MRRKIVAGNWKMHGSTAGNAALVDAIARGVGTGLRAECYVCPPFVYLRDIVARAAGTSIVVGAQNVGAEEGGAFTGEVSAAMLADVGCRAVIVGHSERRSLYGDADAVVCQKFQAAQSAGLLPILCVGETLAEREANQTEAVVAGQLDAVLAATGPRAFQRAVIAYEPVWAIGTGRTASPEQAQAVHAFIRGRLVKLDAIIGGSVRILYGGSVKAGNAAELFAMPDVDGGLIGGASLKADEFLAILRAA